MAVKGTEARRHFLKSVAAGTVAMVFAPKGRGVFAASSEPEARDPGNKWPGKVAVNFNKDATTNNEINKDVVMKMVDQTIKMLTGKDDVGEAWKSVFPATLSLTSKIAVKVICYNPYKVGLNWQTVKGVTEGLRQMTFDGTPFPAANITIYELTTSPTSNAFNVAGYTATNFPGITITSDKTRKIKAGDGALNDREYAQALHDADYLINCFNARGHAYGDSDGKFTLGFKSHFGTYNDPNGMHGQPAGSAVSKNVREITCTGPVFKKHVLSVCGAIFGSNEGNGPGGIMGTDDLKPEDFSPYVKAIDDSASVKHPSTVIMSTDPVSIEMQAIKILRMNKDKQYNLENLPKYVRSSAGIDQSGFTPTYNIGVADEEKMAIVKMVNDVIVSEPVGSHNTPRQVRLGNRMSAASFNDHRSVFFDITLPGYVAGTAADIQIVDVRGVTVAKLRHTVAGSNSHFSWNRHGAGAAPVAAGQYVARLSCGRIRLSTRFTLM